MAEIVVLGAGLSGTLMAFELVPQLRREDRLTVIGQSDRYHFVPSNPWVAVGGRERAAIEVPLPEVMAKRKIRYIGTGARRLEPRENRIELADGSSVPYDYLVIATGPDLAFDGIPGLGPNGGHTQSICQVDHAEKAKQAFDKLAAAPGPTVPDDGADVRAGGPGAGARHAPAQAQCRRGAADGIQPRHPRHPRSVPVPERARCGPERGRQGHRNHHPLGARSGIRARQNLRRPT